MRRLVLANDFASQNDKQFVLGLNFLAPDCKRHAESLNLQAASAISRVRTSNVRSDVAKDTLEGTGNVVTVRGVIGMIFSTGHQGLSLPGWRRKLALRTILASEPIPRKGEG
jgi:hypothetical protein